MGIKSYSLHAPLLWWQRLDVWPFVILQALNLLGGAYQCKDVPGFVCTPHILSLVAIPALFLLQMVAHLGTRWSVEYMFMATTRSVKAIGEATLVKAIPKKETEKVGVCSLVQGSFEFHKRKYVWDASEKRFEKIMFPVNLRMKEYSASKGLSGDEVGTAAAKYGPNSFHVPLPSWKDMYLEQCQQPFFVFQIVCVGLWSLDDMWYMSMFTLVMLLIFEGTVVISRFRNHRMLREIMGNPGEVRVFRNGEWTRVLSDSLLPGDLVSIVRDRSDPDAVVPCDVLLLCGSVVTNESILTGESTPQQKQSIADRGGDEELCLRRQSDTGDRQHIIFGGTRVVQASPSNANLPQGVPRPPDGGCLGYVVRNGFNTAQGKLVRTIIFSQENSNANTREAAILVSVLLVFAVAAAGYVLHHGWHDPARSRSKLILNTCFILASVVPPELPMNLSLAVNSSLNSLAQLGVFCTEPFRIPFAGRVTVACFDKTGTLTSEDLELEGIVAAVVEGEEGEGEGEGGGGLREVEACGDASVVLAACNGIVVVDGELVGESMEVMGLKASGWVMSRPDVYREQKGRRRQLSVVHRFPFASSLARMSVVCDVTEGGGNRSGIVLCKGAPETVRALLAQVPAAYEHVYKKYAREGKRVLALATKPFDNSARGKVNREDVESGLSFVGFVVYHCPLKAQSAPSIRELTAAGHHVVMITGDQILTACHVARQLGITRRSSSLILESVDEGKHAALPGSATAVGYQWRSPDETVSLPFSDSKADVLKLFSDYDLCITGPVIKGLEASGKSECVSLLAEVTRVFARMSPTQKEGILLRLRERGHNTMMCGDGTNDVGALKASHVGVALLQPLHLDEEDGRPSSTAARRGKAGGRPVTIKDLQRELEKEMSQNTQIVRLGDASIASPFTCRQSSIYPTIKVIQQGRCTLVTMLQIYKIQALTCLSLAYCLSALYVDGVKLGDSQMTLSGIFSAILFLVMSHAKPLQTLAPTRPPATILCFYVLFTVAGQFAVHMYTLWASIDMTRPHIVPGWVCSPESTNSTLAKEASLPAPSCAGPCDEIGCAGCDMGMCISDRNPDADFSPNLLNSVVFLVTTSATFATFAANYKGRPYMTPFTSNKPLMYTLLAGVASLWVAALELMPDFNDYLQMTKMPDWGFKLQVWKLLCIDLFGALAVEQACLLLFYNSACSTPTDALLRHSSAQQHQRRG